VYTYLCSLEKEFFLSFVYQYFNFFISHVRMAKDSPGQPGQDSQGRISKTGLLGQGM
jgi:hypothetical protein